VLALESEHGERAVANAAERLTPHEGATKATLFSARRDWRCISQAEVQALTHKRGRAGDRLQRYRRIARVDHPGAPGSRRISGANLGSLLPPIAESAGYFRHVAMSISHDGSRLQTVFV